VILLTLLSFTSSFAAFLLDLLLARKYGAGPIVDAFRAACVALILGAQLIVTQVLPHVIVPYVQRIRDRDGPSQAWRAFASLHLSITAAALVCAVLVGVHAERIGEWLAPGLASAGRTAMTALTPPLAAAAFLILVSGSLSAALHLCGSFGAGFIAPLLLNLGWLSAVLMTDPSNATAALGWGAVGGAAGGMLLHVLQIRRFSRRDGFPDSSWFTSRIPPAGLRTLAGGLIVPVSLSLAALHLGSILIQRALSVSGPGSVAEYMYAQRLTTIAYTPASVYGTRVFPDLARDASARAASTRVLRSLRDTAAIGVAAAAAAWLAREPLVAILFGRGTLPPESLARIADLFGTVIVAAPLGALMSLLQKTFAAHCWGGAMAAAAAGSTAALAAALWWIPAGADGIAWMWVSWIGLNVALLGLVAWRRWRV